MPAVDLEWKEFPDDSESDWLTMMYKENRSVSYPFIQLTTHIHVCTHMHIYPYLSSEKMTENCLPKLNHALKREENSFSYGS